MKVHFCIPLKKNGGAYLAVGQCQSTSRKTIEWVCPACFEVDNQINAATQTRTPTTKIFISRARDLYRTSRKHRMEQQKHREKMGDSRNNNQTIHATCCCTSWFEPLASGVMPIYGICGGDSSRGTIILVLAVVPVTAVPSLVVSAAPS